MILSLLKKLLKVVRKSTKRGNYNRLDKHFNFTLNRFIACFFPKIKIGKSSICETYFHKSFTLTVVNFPSSAGQTGTTEI